MGPFLLLALGWIALTIRYWATGRFGQDAMRLLFFPISFLLLATANVTLNLQGVYTELWNTGEVEVMEVAISGRIFVNATIAIIALAGASLITALLFTCRRNNPAPRQKG